MENFDIVKYLKENKLGSYGMFNGYADLKPLKEEEKETELDTVIPYEGPEDKLTGLGDEDSFEQSETVSEQDLTADDRLEGLINRQDLAAMQTAVQNIFDDLTDDGFEAEDVAEYLMDKIRRAAAPYAQ